MRLFPTLLVAGSLAPALPAQRIVAHRGASYEAPENTIAAFELAWDRGADAIEADVRLTVDGRVVCMHDASTERTADQNLVVADSTLADLLELDVGSWKGRRWRGERVPTLEEVLAVVPPGRQVFLEIKCGREILGALRQVLDGADLEPDRIVVLGFIADVIAAVKDQIPDVEACWLTDFEEDEETGRWTPTREVVLQTLARIRADGLSAQAHETVDVAFVAALRDAGLSLHVWTVDNPSVAGRFRALGVDSITTNRPALVRRGLRGCFL